MKEWNTHLWLQAYKPSTITTQKSFTFFVVPKNHVTWSSCLNLLMICTNTAHGWGFLTWHTCSWPSPTPHSISHPGVLHNKQVLCYKNIFLNRQQQTPGLNHWAKMSSPSLGAGSLRMGWWAMQPSCKWFCFKNQSPNVLKIDCRRLSGQFSESNSKGKGGCGLMKAFFP